MEDGLYGAGAFTIDELRLVTTTGLEIDLITSVMGITLYEGIKSTCITGTVMLSDAVNLASYGPIIGQEYLYLKIRTPSFKGDIGTIDFSENVFLVNSLSSRQQIGNGVQAFVLSFVSQELVRDQRSKVTQSLEGSWSDIVSKMLLNPNYLGTRKKIFRISNPFIRSLFCHIKLCSIY